MPRFDPAEVGGVRGLGSPEMELDEDQYDSTAQRDTIRTDY